MLGILVGIALLVFATLYPTLTAVIIFGIVVCMAVPHVRDRYYRK